MDTQLTTQSDTGKRVFAIGSYYKGYSLVKSEQDGKIGILVAGANGLGIIGSFNTEADARAFIDDPHKVAPLI